MMTVKMLVCMMVCIRIRMRISMGLCWYERCCTGVDAAVDALWMLIRPKSLEIRSLHRCWQQPSIDTSPRRPSQTHTETQKQMITSFFLLTLYIAAQTPHATTVNATSNPGCPLPLSPLPAPYPLLPTPCSLLCALRSWFRSPQMCRDRPPHPQCVENRNRYSV